MDSASIVYSALSLGILGLIFGILLSYASKKFHVEVDEKIPRVREILPGANCGGCGFAGCDAYAKAVIEEDASITACTVGGASVSNLIGDILGVKVGSVERKVAFVKCNGNCDSAKNKFQYEGIKDCVSASLLEGGDKGCSYGCLGLGTCVSACEFDAIEVVNGVAIVDEEKCTNCGACRKVCPKSLIDEVPVEKKIRVQCNSKDMGKIVRSNCTVGCIGCKICEKNCPAEAVKVSDSIALVDYDKCTQCGICVSKCPTKAIKEIITCEKRVINLN
ncbi:RnfABCDGE type electron transport complex subunit B [Clostridium hydrogeniformans]|uniref:RnfABCDGE type electron transport complex subunit B n=1 Tax=Clostridium hydrogeniformans TaxID=349933 RepID=UPI00068FA8CB|nr:RnfABCDGE type electron transport complex subunit B [Clostridium hydrogeniformans]